MIISIKSFDEFNEIIKKHEKLLVDFYADWCGPCKMLSPFLEEISNEKIFMVVKVNVDLLPDIASKYQISALPTILLFESGNEAKRLIGFKPKDYILEYFK